MIKLRKLSDESGFTVSELLIVVVITSIFVLLLGIISISYWRYGYILQADLSTLSTRLNASDAIRNSISTSAGLIIQNSLPDTHALNQDPAQPSGNYWLPVHAIPGNKAMGAAGTFTPIVYYSRFSTNSSKAYIMNGSEPYEDEYVLYLDGSAKALKLRTIANTAATGNRLKTSCPTGLATASCPADKVIAEHVSSIDLRYFSRNGNLIDYTSSTDPVSGAYTGPDYPAVEVLEMKLNLAEKSVFQKSSAITKSTIIRIALRNA